MAPRTPRFDLKRTLAATKRTLGQFKLTDRQKSILGGGALHLLASLATKAPGESLGQSVRSGLERYAKEHGQELLFPKDVETKKSIFELSPEHRDKLVQFTKGAAHIAFDQLKKSKQAEKLATHKSPVVREGYHKASGILENYFNKPMKTGGGGMAGTFTDGVYNAGPVAVA